MADLAFSALTLDFPESPVRFTPTNTFHHHGPGGPLRGPFYGLNYTRDDRLAGSQHTPDFNRVC